MQWLCFDRIRWIWLIHPNLQALLPGSQYRPGNWRSMLQGTASQSFANVKKWNLTSKTPILFDTSG
jgi:hypothetical protein